MDNKTELLATGIALGLAVAFAGGLYLGKSLRETKIETTAQTEQEKQTDVHKEVTTVKTKAPDGTVKIVTTTDIVSNTSVKTDSEITSVKSVTSTAKKLNVSALFAYDYKRPLSIPNYGVSITKEVFGPITASVGYVNSGTILIGFGLDF